LTARTRVVHNFTSHWHEEYANDEKKHWKTRQNGNSTHDGAFLSRPQRLQVDDFIAVPACNVDIKIHVILAYTH
jgi:hypothetical protein